LSKSILDATVQEVATDFLDRDRGLMYENVPDGSHVGCFDGRLINPGPWSEAVHPDVANRRNDIKRLTKLLM